MHDKAVKTEIYSFETLTEFLRSYEKAKREGSSRWSLGVWARQLGLSSTSALGNILKGRRLLSVDMAKKMADSIGLDREEYMYFFLLLEIEKQKENSVVLEVLREKLITIQTVKKKKR